MTTPDDPFVTHRSLLFTVAYEMLGSAADAEDVVQEAWLRWAGVDRAEVRERRAYLVRIVTRQALNRLRTVARRREEYVGEWLPEPLLTSPDVAEDVELAESVSIAMLTVLETLAPAERAVFVLREVFDLPYADIAAAVDKTPAAVRQMLLDVLAPDVVLVGTVWLNGAPADRLDLAGALDTAVSIESADGRITRIYAIRNPHKLAQLHAEAALSR